MGFQVSPGINISEVDLSQVVPQVSTTEGAIAGVFAWGPVLERQLISNESELVRTFGKPVTGYNIETFFTASDFLSYSNILHVVRVNDGNTAYADANTGISANLDELTAKYPGEYGNSLQVVIVDQNTYANSTYENYFDDAPTNANNVHIAVVDVNGKWADTANSIIELHTDISLDDGTTSVGGRNNFLPDVLEQSSRYIAATSGFATSLKTYFTSANAVFDETFTGGADGNSESDIGLNDITGGYEQFLPSNEVDVSLIMQGKARGSGNDGELANFLIQNICEVRKDCIALISPAYEDVVNNSGEISTDVIAFRNTLTASSYGVVDSGYKYRYDRYNDRYVYTPLNGDIAGLCARTDYNRDPWFSPAGYNRGIIKNVVKLSWNPNKAERDQLYKNGVNPVISQAGQGILLFGDKTLAGVPSAFDRINVRRLFIILEKSISRASQSALFEFNDEFTRAQFINLVEPFLRDVQGRRGIFDFKVVCDTTNNTAEVIDGNRFVGDIYVKPARSINFIQLNFVAVRTGVEFDEIVGRF